MKISPLERKKETEKIRKERVTLFNNINNLGSNGANVYMIVKYNGKYFIYNSRSDKEWPPLDIILVSKISYTKGILTARRRDIIRF